MKNKDLDLTVSLALAVLLLTGCGGGLAEHTIEVTREVDLAGDEIHWNATSAERFGLALPGVSGAPNRMPPPPAAGPELAWETPPGWEERPATQFRSVNFVIPASQAAGSQPIECYLTILAGDAGGLAANANRWRQQMSQPPSSEADIQRLPRLAFFGTEATFIDVEGTFSGMGGQNSENYRLLGLLLIEPGGSRFLKLYGPKAAVDEQVQNFRNLAASFNMRAPAEPTGVTGTRPSSGGMTYTAPDHWEPAPAQQMRQINFLVGPEREIECYVTVLPGSAGGAAANFKRWCGQMGRPELTPAEFEALERFEMLGYEASMAEIEGSFQALSGALMLGVVGQSETGATFVKMIGPRALVAAEREAFLSFCKSLRTGD